MGKNATLCIGLIGLLAAGCGGGGTAGNSNPGGGGGDVFSLLVDTLRVSATFPADGAVQVPVNAEIAIEFDGVIAQECTAEPDTWLKLDGTGAPVAGSFSVTGSGRTVRFRPDSPLAIETDYVFQLSALTCDVDGKLLEEEYSFGFRTIDTTPPTVANASVADGASGVSRTAAITIDFDEDLSPTSVTPTTVYLKDVFGSTFATAAAVDGSRLTVDPVIDLPGNRGFVLVALGGASGVQDASGNGLVSSHSIGFTTASDATPPTLLTSWPNGGALRSPEIEPRFTFDDSMDPLTVETGSVVFVDEFANIVPYTTQTSPDQKTLRFVPTAPLVVGRAYSVGLTGGAGGVTDVSGNSLPASAVILFTIGTDATPPMLSSSTVADGATAVSPNAKPKLRFDGSLDPARIDSTLITLRDTAGTSVPITITTENADATIKVAPLVQLEASTDYVIRVAGGAEGIRDVAGNYMPSHITIGFRTSNDPTLPEVLIAPLNGSNAISRDTVVSAVFDSPLDPFTVGPATVYLQEQGGGLIDGTVELIRADRVIRFTPTNDLNVGTLYFFTIVGGPDGVRESSGNWLEESAASQFRIYSQVDALEPSVAVTLNATNALRADDLVMPPFGFEVNVSAIDSNTYNQDMSSAEITISGPSTIDSETVFATAIVEPTTVTYRVPSTHELSPGSYTLTARVRDLSGNLGVAADFKFDVAGATDDVVPFERTQVVWLRLDLDRDGNGRGDFLDDLYRLGFASDAGIGTINDRMFEVLRDGILSRVHQLYERKPNGGRLGSDSVPIRFTHRQPLGVASMQMALGGFDPEGASNRGYGDETSGTLGRALYDYRNARFNDNNTGVNPGVGVFPAELFLYEASIHDDVYPSFVTTFGQAFLPIQPDMGGDPVGTDARDATVISASFDYATASTLERARYNQIFIAADQWATAIGTILAHEAGHSLGLVAPGRESYELHGDASLHNEYANLSDIMAAAVGYDGLVTLDYAFRDLNLAYLRHRLLLK
ncbi:MAG: Ig-like domain-containing protein [Planctomycetes bacterium]|nr:Ig-like domain-containing protein [Planctomycetota bacterium]